MYGVLAGTGIRAVTGDQEIGDFCWKKCSCLKVTHSYFLKGEGRYSSHIKYYSHWVWAHFVENFYDNDHIYDIVHFSCIFNYAYDVLFREKNNHWSYFSRFQVKLLWLKNILISLVLSESSLAVTWLTVYRQFSVIPELRTPCG